MAIVPDSQFTGVLHTNYAPSAKELKELEHLVIEPQERIRKLDEEIKRLQTQRDELQQFVDSHRALAAPFRRLPADIWGEIFVHCLPTNRLNLAVCTVKEAPLLFTTVCRAWKEVALNTPRLWSSLHILASGSPTPSEIDCPRRQLQEKILRGIELWLNRSGSRPLTLSVYMVESGLTDEQSGIVSTYPLELMDLLAKYSHRWRTLSFGPGVRVSHQRSFDQLTADGVPLLETIYTGDFNLFADIHLFYPPLAGSWNNNPPPTSTPSPTPMANFISKISSLRSLHLQQGSIPTLEIPLGWSHLTELSFDFSPLDNSSTSSSPRVLLQRIAQSCRSLVILTLRAYLPLGETRNVITDPIEWTSLQELNISLDGLFCDYTTPDGHPNTDGPFLFLPHIQDIYGCIITPQLLRLSIQLGHRRWGDPTFPTSDDILPFHALIQSSSRLMNLRIGGYHILKPEALAQCLQSSLSLDTLTLLPERSPSRRRRVTGPRTDETISPTGDWVPRLLSSLNDLEGSCGCPNLEVFDIGRCGEHNNLSSILDFFQSESRISRLKLLKADMGELWGERALAIASNASLVETLRTVHGISVDINWKEIEPPKEYWRHDPSTGLPDNIYDLAMHP
ncbi:hypothetical protein PQX77_015929 [Marasmius sp. AFHP31]|nr:hypothetical protein PQX77_015929 [Marasmius sp. AFHP31]